MIDGCVIDEETEDMLNIDNNEAMVITELPNQNRSRANLPSECRELLQRIKNVTFDVEENSEVLWNLRKHLKSYYRAL